MQVDWGTVWLNVRRLSVFLRLSGEVNEKWSVVHLNDVTGRSRTHWE